MNSGHGHMAMSAFIRTGSIPGKEAGQLRSGPGMTDYTSPDDGNQEWTGVYGTASGRFCGEGRPELPCVRRTFDPCVTAAVVKQQLRLAGSQRIQKRLRHFRPP